MRARPGPSYPTFNLNPVFRLLRLGSVILTFAAMGWAGPAEDIISATGVTAGLCVHLGVGDGALTADLDNGGKMVVHGLALDDASLLAARAAVNAKGKHGIITVETPATWNTLPYPQNFVNLLVGDVDQLGSKAPTQAEVERVLAPEGVAYLKKGGAWSKYVKPMPKDMDEWRHWNGNGDGNGVSQDAQVGPPSNVRWWAGYRNGVGKHTNNGFRLHQGTAVYEYYPGKSQRHVLMGRDAFSGVLLWKITADTYLGNDAYRPIVAGSGKVYTIQRKEDVTKGRAPLIGYDIRTGQRHKEYTEALLMGAKGYAEPRYTDWWDYKERMSVTYYKGLLIQTMDNKVRAVDAETGVPKWTYEDAEEKFVWQPVVSESDNLVYVGAGDGAFGIIRIGHAWAKAFVALDLNTGKPKWRYRFPKPRLISQILAAPGRLFALNQPEYAAPKKGDTVGVDMSVYSGLRAAYRAADGKPEWEKTFANGYGTSAAARILVYRDDKLTEISTWSLKVFDPATGVQIDSLSRLGYGNVGDHSRPGYGCEWNRSTVNYHIISGGFVDKNKMVNRHFVSRSGCATGAFPGYGSLFVPDNGCSCFSKMAGMLALSSEATPIPMPDRDRLRHDGPNAQPYTQMKAPTGPLVLDWSDNSLYPASVPAVSGGGMTYETSMQLQQVTAKDGAGKGLWTFTAGGRITAAPVLHQGRLFIGSRDGWVYALDAKTGKLQWRFLAAPNDQKMMTASQLESRWPIMGLALHEGKVAVSAGLHPEVGNGIYFYGLDPAAGAIGWKFAIRSPRGFTTPEGAQKTYAPKIQNGAMEVVNGQLQITSFSHGASSTSYLLKPTEWNGLDIDARARGELMPGVTGIVDMRILPQAPRGERFIPEITAQGSRIRIRLEKASSSAKVDVRDMEGRLHLSRFVQGQDAGLDAPGLRGIFVVTVRQTGRFAQGSISLP